MLIHANTDHDEPDPTVHATSGFGNFPLCQQGDEDATELDWTRIDSPRANKVRKDWTDAHDVVRTPETKVTCTGCLEEPDRADIADRLKIIRVATAFATLMGVMPTALSFDAVEMLVEAHREDTVGSTLNLKLAKLADIAGTLVDITDLDAYRDLFAAVFERTLHRSMLTTFQLGQFKDRPAHILLALSLKEAWKTASHRKIEPGSWTFVRNIEQAYLMAGGEIIESSSFKHRADAREIRAALAYIAPPKVDS